jgi:hypothetical protein
MMPTTLEESVKKRAYELYQKRDGNPGNDRDDWYKAEREVKSQYNDTIKSNGKKRPGGLN